MLAEVAARHESEVLRGTWDVQMSVDPRCRHARIVDAELMEIIFVSSCDRSPCKDFTAARPIKLPLHV